MKMSHETDRLPQPYTPTPDGFERRLRAWVRLPTDNETTPDARDASAPPKESGARDQAGGMTRTRKGHRRRRKGGPDA
jgi:hypothetical protein